MYITNLNLSLISYPMLNSHIDNVHIEMLTHLYADN